MKLTNHRRKGLKRCRSLATKLERSSEWKTTSAKILSQRDVKLTNPTPLSIEVYFYFLVYLYLHRAYPLHWGLNGLTTIVSPNGHGLHMELIRLDAPFVITPRVTSGSRGNYHHRVLRPNPVENPTSVALGGFEAQPPKLP
jgi:hypothetical protein